MDSFSFEELSMNKPVKYNPEWCNTFECRYPSCGCTPPKTVKQACADLLEHLHWNVFPHLLHKDRQPIIELIEQIEKADKR
jgi:hypothetical protein